MTNLELVWIREWIKRVNELFGYQRFVPTIDGNVLTLYDFTKAGKERSEMEFVFPEAQRRFDVEMKRFVNRQTAKRKWKRKASEQKREARFM